MAKIKLEDIIEEAAKHNWQVVSLTYKNLQTEMEFICSEGHQVIAPYQKIRNIWKCPVCENNYSRNRVDKKVIPKKEKVYRVLALDQATHVSGFSIFDDDKLIKSGIYKAREEDEITRDEQISNWLMNMIEIWQPDIIGLEDIQLQQFNNKSVGVTTYKVLAHLQGILMLICHELNKPYVICPPATWRSYCQVKGRTKTDKKRSMQVIVKELYDVTVTNDEADAIGIGRYVANKKFKKPVYDIKNWEE